MPWLRLLRLPNFTTVPGDGLVGMLAVVAASGESWEGLRFLPVAVILLCLYWTGLILNDCWDLSEDWHHRRWDRPLVAGEISLDRAGAAALLLVALAVFTAWWLGRMVLPATLLLLGLIIFYDGVAKRRGWMAVMTMGLCRAGAVILGAVAQAPLYIFSWPVAVAALGLGGYIALVTGLARNEHAPRRFDREVFSPTWYVFLFYWLVLATALASGTAWPYILIGSLVFLFLLRTMVQSAVDLMINRRVHPPRVIRTMIGRLLGGLIPLQAGLAIMFGQAIGLMAAIIMIALLIPLRQRLANFFSCS